jgi:hypothetical protein
VADAASGTLSLTPPSTLAAPLLVTAGAGGEVSVTVKNTDTKGSANPLTVQLLSSDPAFQVSGGCNVALGPGITCTFVVSYTAAAPTQDATASVSVSGKKREIVAATAFFKVVGVAPVAAPVAALSPASLSFADTPVGATTADQLVRVTNTGNANLFISGLFLSGASQGDFVLSANTCLAATLPAGASCTISIAFRPTAVGAKAATLSVADNAAGSPQTVALSGTATP